MIPVEGHKGLYRDETTNAILNCNDYQYRQYLMEKQNKLEEKKEIDMIKNEISELKSLLLQFIKDKT